MILDAHGREVRIPVRIVPSRAVRAGFDAAKSTGPHVNHWTNADALSADSAASPAVRRTLRNRSRYEVFNNSYAFGIVSTLANYVVSTGPTLRLAPKAGAGKRAATYLQDLATRFNAWAWDVQLARKLALMQRAKTTDGEGLCLLTSRTVPADQVSLGMIPFEADMLADPAYTSLTSDDPDGIVLGPDGEPKAYRILKHHPGGGYFPMRTDDVRTVPAASVCHWYDELRPGLHRGLPEILPALPLFAQLRRYTQAVITAAETAADLAGVLQTDTPPGEADEVDAGTTFDLEKGTLITTPTGWHLSQIKAEHPGPMHETFIRTLIREACRCVDMPYAVGAMDASGHNYSSMRGDWQAFLASLRMRRLMCDQLVLDKILSAWMSEARLIWGDVPGHDYFWDWPGWEPVDLVKEAQAAQIKLANRLTTYAREYARQGLNWREEFQQIAREDGEMAELGIARPSPAPVPVDKEGDQ